MPEPTDLYEPEHDQDDGDGELDESYLRARERELQLQIRTHIPATVVSYDADKNLATVTVDALLVTRARDGVAPDGAVSTDGDGADLQAVLPAYTVQEVPVDWGDTDAAGWSFPLGAGDTGQLHVSDRSMDRWRKEGKPVDPLIGVLHDLAQCVFKPGLRPDAKQIARSNTAAVLRVDDAKCPEGIKLHQDAEEAVVLAGPLAGLLSGLLDAMSAAVGVSDGGAAAITAGKAFLALYAPVDGPQGFAAEKVRAK